MAFKNNALGKGVNIDDCVVSLILYADDVVLIAETEIDLQTMLDVLGTWCKNNVPSINASKSTVVHFRNPSVSPSAFVFKVYDAVITYAKQYKYLGFGANRTFELLLNSKNCC